MTKAEEELKRKQASLKNKAFHQNKLDEMLNKYKMPTEAFYSPENANWYTKPLSYNNEYVNEPWAQQDNFVRAMENAADYSRATGGPQFPAKDNPDWSGKYKRGDIQDIYNTLRNYKYIPQEEIPGNDLNTEDLIKYVQNLINTAKTKNATLPQAIYQGQQTAPMSSLTQRVLDLKSQYSQKGAPYQNKINKVLARSQQGLTPQDIEEVSDVAKQGQQDFSQRGAFKALNDSFGGRLGGIEPEFLNKANETANREANLSKERLGVLGQKIGNIQGMSNNTLVDLLEMLKSGKQQKRETYLKTGEEFGGQKHAHSNMEIEANKQKFYDEANAPHRDLAMLEQALAAQGSNPDLVNPTELRQALTAAGIDLNLSRSEEQTPKRYQGYTGQRVAHMTPETLTSHKLMEYINPKTTRASTYPQEKKAIEDLMNEENTVGKEAIRQLPGSVNNQIQDLERRANELIQEKVGNLTNKYVTLGQVGSTAHTQEARRIAEKINNILAAERTKLTEEGLGTQAHIAQGDKYNKIRQAARLGTAGHHEFMNSMQNVKNVNEIGQNKFMNDQNELERIYNNYQSQNIHQWPHMRDLARRQVLDQTLPGKESTIFSRLNPYNTAYNQANLAMRDRKNELARLEELNNNYYPTKLR